ncbi:MAG: arginine--tRNA ligase, partial [Clostridia bacterium]|nr:arginine--tRNA ligase [Clostridia bacterium]
MKDYPSYIENILNSNMPGVDFNGACVISQNPLADYTVPCFKFAKILRKSPVAIAQQLKPFFDNDTTFESVSEVNGYLNFKLNKISQANEVISSVLGSENYGSSKLGNGKTICIDYSSINIAKPFHIGHLSTTVIGAALARIYAYLGYKVVSINHLGDWGTQFGKLISAYKRYGNEEAVIKGGVKELMKIYVKFHEEAEKDPSLNDEARAYFKAIEDGSEEEMKLYNFFKEITLNEVSKTYSALNVKFDSYAGESFYNDKMAPIINELKDKGLMTLSDGAYVVPLSDYNMPPCIILRSDGATLYATRDLAAAEYRYNTYDFEKCLYVVAYQQNLHFQQIFKVMELMEKPYADRVEHVSYGMVSLEDGVSLSTRHGNVVFLEDVIKTAIDKAKSIITEKNPNLADKDEIARKVGTGAV